MNTSHFYFLHQLFLINSKIFHDYEFDGIWVNPVVRRSNNIFGFISYNLRFFFSSLLYIKWSKLYKAIGIKQTFNISQIDISDYQRKQSYKNAKFFLRTKIKKKFMFNNLICGDLITDTYLRFFKKVKIINNTEANYNVIQIFEYMYKFNNFLNKKIKTYDVLFPIQASFVSNGYLVRYFLKYKKKVIGGWNFSQYLKKFSKSNNLHHYKWENYKKLFSKLKNKKNKLLLAQKFLNKRFSGGVDQTNYYMKRGSYSNVSKIKKKYIFKNKKKINCIIFLPCFVDSPFAFGDIVFNDGYDWIIKTLKYLKQHKIITVVKEHPNSKTASINFVKKLKKEYSDDFIWVDKNIPNDVLFKLKPKVCISLRGNVLIEIAYHKIIAISAGRNPFCSYEFVITPKSENEYFRKISLANKDKFKFKNDKYKNDILECFYMHYLNNNDYNYTENYSREFNINRFMKDYLSSSKIFEKLKPDIAKITKLN